MALALYIMGIFKMESEMGADWLKKWNLYSPNSIALQDGESQRSLSYRQLFHLSLITSLELKKIYQIKKRDRIALLAQNELEHLVLFFACQRIGAILVPINYRLTPRELQYIFSDASPSLLLFGEDFQEVVEKCDNSPSQKKLFLTSSRSAPKDSCSSFFSPIYEAEKNKNLPNINLPFEGEFESPCMIIYTSGTTGAPKGAVLSNRMIFWNSINTSLRLNIVQSDCTVSFLPFFHTGGWNVLTLPFLHRGAKVVLLKKFDPDLILKLSELHRSTLLFGVPTTMDRLSRSPFFQTSNLSQIRYAVVGGEPMPIPLIDLWNQKGIPIRQGYGLTEFGPNVFSLNEEDSLRKRGSIGFPNFYIEAKVINEDGSEAPDGNVGELLLCGPSMMTGYWNNPSATEKTIQNGWLLTEDLVRKDEEGYFYVIGRKKEMYKSGGENVYPSEIEQVLSFHSDVVETAVVGVPDPKWGEVGRAFVVPKHFPPPPHLEKTLLEHCQNNLAKFKIPKYFTFLPDLPKGDSGKILKRVLNTYTES